MCIFQNLAQHFEHLYLIGLYTLSQQEQTEMTTLKQQMKQLIKQPSTLKIHK